MNVGHLHVYRHERPDVNLFGVLGSQQGSWGTAAPVEQIAMLLVPRCVVDLNALVAFAEEVSDADRVHLEAEVAKAVERSAHRLKGSVGNFGMNATCAAALRMEVRAARVT